MEKITINGIEYIKQDTSGLKWVIVRTLSAGVFYGQIEKREGKEVTLVNARRMWQWFGASLSQCAQSGTPDVNKCKFPETVNRVLLLEAIEILDLTESARETLDKVEIWEV